MFLIISVQIFDINLGGYIVMVIIHDYIFIYLFRVSFPASFFFLTNELHRHGNVILLIINTYKQITVNFYAMLDIFSCYFILTVIISRLNSKLRLYRSNWKPQPCRRRPKHTAIQKGRISLPRRPAAVVNEPDLHHPTCY